MQHKCVPPKLTWRCQPAGVAWMKPLKDNLQARWVENLRAQPTHHDTTNGAFVIAPPGRSEVAQWVLQTWLAVSSRTIMSGFAHLRFTSFELTYFGFNVFYEKQYFQNNGVVNRQFVHMR